MAYNKYPRLAVHAFADKYIKFFEEEFGRSRESYSRLFDSSEFPNECRSLGFEMNYRTRENQYDSRTRQEIDINVRH